MPKSKSSISVPAADFEANAPMRSLEQDERFLRRIESTRKSLRAGRGKRLENVFKAGDTPSPLGEKVPRRGG